MLQKSEIIRINQERLKALEAPYSPITGEGSFSVERVHVNCDDFPLKDMWIPVDFAETGFVKVLLSIGMKRYIQSILNIGYTKFTENLLYVEFCRQRFIYDFEFWAYMTSYISPKGGGEDIRFMLNRAQRVYLTELEKLRMAGRPINIILLKARQWGGSTLTQIYMLWIQIIHRKNWNSVICGDVESQSNIVSGMLSKVVKNYPAWATGGQKLETKPFEGSTKTRQITYCQCLYSVGSAQKPDNLRSQNIAMAHLTEVGLWKETKGKKPEDLVQSIFGSINDGPYTVKVLESTAKGVGNYFHRTWLSAEKGKNSFTPVFIPWFIIDMYTEYIGYKNYFAFIDTMTEYEHYLFSLGATLEAIAWYRTKKKDMEEEWRMCSEYPSDPKEAFQSTGRPYFPRKYVENARVTCMEPCFFGEFVGEDTKGKKAFENLRFVHIKPKEKGNDNILQVWTMPDSTAGRFRYRYVVSVDIGGTGKDSDYSSIKVADRLPMIEGGIPEIVAEWHGHIEHDLLIWKAAQIAAFYDNSLLVIESNTLETHDKERQVDGDQSQFILNQIKDVYPNLYARKQSEEDIREGLPKKYGFHTNVATKPMIISTLIKVVREGLYTERDGRCLDEYLCYEKKPNGAFGAIVGKHDDLLMTRAIGLHICFFEMDVPKFVSRITSYKPKRKRAVSAATI